MPPVDGSGHNGVCLLGEAYGDKEVVRDTPFKGPAGFRLERLIQQTGAQRDDFLLTNVAWFQPPGNREPTELEVEVWRPHWEQAIQQAGTKVVVPLGNVPLRSVLGHWGIQSRRGYLEWSERLSCWVLPTVHPSFIMRGNAPWTAAWLRDVGMALQVAQDGPPLLPKRELLLDPPIGVPDALSGPTHLRVPDRGAQDLQGGNRGRWAEQSGDSAHQAGQAGHAQHAVDLAGPPPRTAWEWGERWQRVGCPPLAVDIETPDKSEDEDETELAQGTAAGTIFRVGLAYRHNADTLALSVPWGGEYTEVVRNLLQPARTALVWNRHFDVPRLRAYGVVAPLWHDVQEMWHVFHTDLKKSLAFAAPFLVPAQPYWKDQAYARPAYYNAIDAAVTAEGYEVLWGKGLEGGEVVPKVQDLPAREAYDQNQEDDIPF